MKSTKRTISGVSLLETSIGFLIIALLGATLFVAYARMFAFTRKSDTEMLAATHFESINQVFRHRAKRNWPDSVSVPRQAIGDFFYSVEDLGLFVNPLDPEEPIEMKKIAIRLDYKVRGDNGEELERQMESSIFVGR